MIRNFDATIVVLAIVFIHSQMRQQYLFPQHKIGPFKFEPILSVKRARTYVMSGPQWAHRDLNPGFSPCKGDVITDLDHEPSEIPSQKPFKL